MFHTTVQVPMTTSPETPTRVLPDGRTLLPVLTDRQAECLRFIYRYALAHRDYPLGTEVAEHLGISKQAVASVLTALLKKGYAIRDRSVAQRNIRLTREAVEKMSLEEGEGTTLDMFENALPSGS